MAHWFGTGSPHSTHEPWYSYLSGDYANSWNTPRQSKYLYPTWGSYMQSFLGYYSTSDYGSHYHNSLGKPTYQWSSSNPYQSWGEWLFGSGGSNAHYNNYGYGYGAGRGGYGGAKGAFQPGGGAQFAFDNINNSGLSLNPNLGGGGPYLGASLLNSGLHDYPGVAMGFGGKHDPRTPFSARFRGCNVTGVATSPHYDGAGTATGTMFDSSYTHPGLRFRGRELERHRERYIRHRLIQYRFWQNYLEEGLQILFWVLLLVCVYWVLGGRSESVVGGMNAATGTASSTGTSYEYGIR